MTGELATLTDAGRFQVTALIPIGTMAAAPDVGVAGGVPGGVPGGEAGGVLGGVEGGVGGGDAPYEIGGVGEVIEVRDGFGVTRDFPKALLRRDVGFGLDRVRREPRAVRRQPYSFAVQPEACDPSVKLDIGIFTLAQYPALDGGQLRFLESAPERVRSSHMSLESSGAIPVSFSRSAPAAIAKS